MTHVKPLIALQHVDVAAHNGSLPILKKINLAIAPGEWVSIVGKNGSGKTTLAHVMAGLIAPSGGTIERGDAIAMPIPYVMQREEQWFGETPWEDVVFVLESRGEDPDRIPELAEAALRRVRMDALMHRPLRELSGGQRQLAAVAGCLAVSAPLLLCDEATAMLDGESRRLVVDAIRELHRSGVTIVWLTHLMEEVAEGGRVVVIENGSIVFDGSTEAFFYGKPGSDALGTPCEQAGYAPPFAVQVARVLLRDGASFRRLPLNHAELTKAVSGRGR